MTKDIKDILDKLDSNLNPIKEQAIRYFDIESNVGADNVVQIFKRPWVAPENFGLILYPPVEKEWLFEFERKTGKIIPKLYEEILLQMNGCFVYDFSLFGLPKSIYTKGVLDRCILQQFDLTEANSSWIREYDANQDLFHIGSHCYDERIGYFVDNNTILSIKETGEIVNSFATVKDFLIKEIEMAEKIMIMERDDK